MCFEKLRFTWRLQIVQKNGHCALDWRQEEKRSPTRHAIYLYRGEFSDMWGSRNKIARRLAEQTGLCRISVDNKVLCLNYFIKIWLFQNPYRHKKTLFAWPRPFKEFCIVYYEVMRVFKKHVLGHQWHNHSGLWIVTPYFDKLATAHYWLVRSVPMT